MATNDQTHEAILSIARPRNPANTEPPSTEAKDSGLSAKQFKRLNLMIVGTAYYKERPDSRQ